MEGDRKVAMLTASDTPEISIERAQSVRISPDQRRRFAHRKQHSLDVPDSRRESGVEDEDFTDAKRHASAAAALGKPSQQQQQQGRTSPGHSPLLNRRNKMKRQSSVYRRGERLLPTRRGSLAVDDIEMQSSIAAATTTGANPVETGAKVGDIVPFTDCESDDDDDYAYDEWTKPWFKTTVARYFYMILYLIAAVSVACNSPATFTRVNWMIYATMSVDCVSVLPFFLLILADLRYRGLIKKKRKSAPFVKNLWCWLDLTVYLCLLGSIALQCIEIYCHVSKKPTWGNMTWDNTTWDNTTRCNTTEEKPFYFSNDARSLVRAPRALTLLLIFRFAKFKSPSARTKQILKRAGKQIRNAALLFGFFVLLFALIGVQVFQDSSDHCINKKKLNELLPNETFLSVDGERRSITYEQINYTGSSVLAFPDTRCHLADKEPVFGPFSLFPRQVSVCPRSENESMRRCPPDHECFNVQVNRLNEELGDFAEIYSAFLTVYECSSQEAWSFVMYNTADYIGGPGAIIFFILLVILVGWLAENVFVVVVIEAFADFRSKFLNRIAPLAPSSAPTRLLRRIPNGRGWRLESVVKKSKDSLLKRVIDSKPYLYATFAIIFVDAVLRSCRIVCRPGKVGEGSVYVKEMCYASLTPLGSGGLGLEDDVLFYIEAIITVLFDADVVVKLLAYGVKPYFYSKTKCIEFVIAIGSTVNVIFWKAVDGDGNPHYFALFPIFRIVLLFLGFKSFRNFLKTILGDGRRLGLLLFATFLFLFIFGIVTMQAFCHFERVSSFATFPSAFMGAFQLIIQEQWVELTSEVMHQTVSYVAYASSILFFLPVHLIGSLIIFSTFVALINDNLELPEEEKIKKQEEVSQINIRGKKELPIRLRVYNKFKDNPKWVRIPHAPDHYETPLIRESVMRQFIESGEQVRDEWRNEGQEALQQSRNDVPLPRRETHIQLLTSVASARPSLFRKRSSIASILNESNKSRRGQKGVMTLRRSLAPMLSPQHRSLTQSAFNDSSSPATNKRRTFRRQKARERNLEAILGNDANVQNIGHYYDGGDQGTSGDGVFLKMRRQKEEALKQKQDEMERLKENHQYFDKSLFLFSEDHWLRKFCLNVTQKKYSSGLDEKDKKEFTLSIVDNLKEFFAMLTYLDWIALLLAILSTAFLVLETDESRSANCDSLRVVDIIFVVALGLELTMEIIANGFFFCPKGFFKDFASVIDLVLFLVSALYLILGEADDVGNESAGMKALLVMRSLRPLRIVTLVPNLKNAIYETFIVKTGSDNRSNKDILYAFIAVALFIFLFASYGLQIYAGKMWRCNDVNVSSYNECSGTFEITVSHSTHLLIDEPKESTFLVPRVWTNSRECDFDHIYTAFLCLFEVITLEGWVKLREALHMQIGWHSSIFLFTYIFLGILVVLTLFVGVILANFQKNNGTALLTVDQRRWRDLKKRLEILQPLTVPPRPENSALRSWIYDLFQSKMYKWVSVFLVLLQSFMLSIPWITKGQKHRDRLKDDDSIIALISITAILQVVYVVEVVLKIVGLSLRGYFMSKRNIFEFCISLLGFAFVCMAVIELSSGEKSQNYLKIIGIVCIVLRYVVLIGKITALKMLMQTLGLTVMRSTYVILSLLVFVFCYALAGVVLFSKVKWSEGINRHANFFSGSYAIMVMFRVMTGEDWNKLMHDCMIRPEFCDKDIDCGNQFLATLFFISFYILVSFIFLNVFIAVLMENFSLFYSSEEDALLTHAELKKFLEAWNVVDKKREGHIPYERARFLFRLLEGRLEMDMEYLEHRLVFNYLCKEVEKTSKESGENRISFHAVLGILAYQALDNFEDFLLIEEVWQRKELDDTIRYEVAQQTIRDWLSRSIEAMTEYGFESSRPSPVPPPMQPSMQHYGSTERDIVDPCADSDSDDEGAAATPGGGGAAVSLAAAAASLQESVRPLHSQSIDPEGVATDDIISQHLLTRGSPGLETGSRRRHTSGSSDEMAPMFGTRKATEEICKWFDEQLECPSDDCSD